MSGYLSCPQPSVFCLQERDRFRSRRSERAYGSIVVAKLLWCGAVIFVFLLVEYVLDGRQFFKVVTGVGGAMDTSGVEPCSCARVSDVDAKGLVFVSFRCASTF